MAWCRARSSTDGAPVAFLIPAHLATKDELETARPDDYAAAKNLKARAQQLGQSVSAYSWQRARINLGRYLSVGSDNKSRSKSRRAVALQLIMSATGYRPLPKQLAMHIADHEDRIDKFFAGGVGTGKSTSAVVEDLICILCLPGVRGLIVAPTYDQALHVLLPIFLGFCEQMERAGYPILRKFYWSQMRAELIDGGEVFFRSTSKVDNILGFSFGWAHFDETETIANPERVWDALNGRMRAEGPFRQMTGTSTPRGLRGVIGKFQAARESYTTDAERADLRQRYFFIRATTLENPHLPADYVESLRRTYSKAAWDQEVLAKILRPEAAVYQEFERSRHEFSCASRAEFMARLKAMGVPYDVAYDPGQTYAHVLWIARFAECDVIFDELCEDNITVERMHAEIVQRCLALARPPTWFVCDRAVKRERAWAAECFPQSRIQIMDSHAEQSIIDGISIMKSRLDPMIGDPVLKVAGYMWDRMPRRAIVKCFMEYRYGQQADGLLSRMPYRDNKVDHGMDAIRMFVVKRYGDIHRFLVVQRRAA